jgi:hypothetical protein
MYSNAMRHVPFRCVVEDCSKILMRKKAGIYCCTKHGNHKVVRGHQLVRTKYARISNQIAGDDLSDVSPGEWEFIVKEIEEHKQRKKNTSPKEGQQQELFYQKEGFLPLPVERTHHRVPHVANNVNTESSNIVPTWVANAQGFYSKQQVLYRRNPPAANCAVYATTSFNMPPPWGDDVQESDFDQSALATTVVNAPSSVLALSSNTTTASSCTQGYATKRIWIRFSTVLQHNPYSLKSNGEFTWAIQDVKCPIEDNCN